MNQTSLFGKPEGLVYVLGTDEDVDSKLRGSQNCEPAIRHFHAYSKALGHTPIYFARLLFWEIAFTSMQVLARGENYTRTKSFKNQTDTLICRGSKTAP